jgi:penicillin-binding protein 1A
MRPCLARCPPSFWRPLALSAALALAGLTWPSQAGVFDLPSLERIVRYQPRLPLQVLTSDGVEIAQFGSERRRFVPLAQMPRLLQDAVLSVEDWRFREHTGIDPKGMARAALAMLTGGMRQGASTITQQLVRTMLLTPRFTPERKAKEIVLALQVERTLGKDRILEIYLNEIFLGQRAYGFAAAAQTYFGKPLDALSVAETAMLAGLPQNPHYANPVANLARATARQRIVLQRMRATGVIDEATHRAALAEKLSIRPPERAPVQAAHVAEMARRVVVARFGEAAYASGLRVVTSLRAADQQAARAAVDRAVLAFDARQPWRGPEDQEALPDSLTGAELERAAAEALKQHRDDERLRVAIVLRASPQELQVQLASGEQISLRGTALRRLGAALDPTARGTQKVSRGSILRLAQAGGLEATPRTNGERVAAPTSNSAWMVAQWPEVEAAFVSLDPATGRVRALVGGFDFARQPFNHVTQAWRQAGSVLKPLLVSAALEHRVMPATVIDDAPFTGWPGWSPRNGDGRFDGPMSLRDALARSKNLVSIRVLQHVGVQPARDWLARFGLDAARQPADLTLALGSGEVTPLQLAQAYGVLANGGWRLDPVIVERVIDAQDRVVYEAPQAPLLDESRRAIPERNAFVVTRLLGDVTRHGTAARAQAELRRPDLYGKTGTTDDARDAWFAGFHPGVVAVAWMGYDRPRSLGAGESGGGLALPIWVDYLRETLRGMPVMPVPLPPTGLVGAEADRSPAAPAQPSDPEAGDWLFTEWRHGGWVVRLDGQGQALYAPTTWPLDPLPADAPAMPAASSSAPGGTP